MRIGPARAEAWSVPAPGVHAAPINFPLNRGGRFCAESGSAVSGPGRTGSHEGRDDFRFQYVSTASVDADLRSEGLCTMAPDLSHRGRGRTWCRTRCAVAPVRRRSENDDANDHDQADETPAPRMAYGRERFSHLGRKLRARSKRK